MSKLYQVVVSKDLECPEDVGCNVYGPATFEVATAFVNGAQYANDSMLTLKVVPVTKKLTSIFVLDDGETYASWGCEVFITNKQLGRIRDDESVYEVVPNWNNQQINGD